MRDGSAQDVAAKPNKAIIEAGESVYNNNCAVCHGDQLVSSGQFPNLRRLSANDDLKAAINRFVLETNALCDDAQQLAGAPHNRGVGRISASATAGAAKGKIGFHGGKVALQRPRCGSYDGHEVALPTGTAAQADDLLGRWAMDLMLINVSTRKLRRAVRLPRAICQSLPGMAPRSQRPRAGS
jgi:hypothetical protein